VRGATKLDDACAERCDPGTYGNAFVIPSFAVDAQGRINSVSTVSVDFSAVDDLRDDVGNLQNLVTTETANIVAAVNSVYTKNTFPAISIGAVDVQTEIKTSVNSTGAIIASFDKSYRFAKLIINVEDLTYGQYQSSEILLIQDTSSVILTEYAIVFSSTNPICTFEASSNATSVLVTAKPKSSDNTITTIKLLS
jgi:hypothetical protein